MASLAERLNEMNSRSCQRGMPEWAAGFSARRDRKNEVEAEAYPYGVVVPLSTFDPEAIPDPAGKEVVFACRSGKRSVTASLAAQAAGLPYDKHLAGGMLGWKAAGLPSKVGG